MKSSSSSSSLKVPGSTTPDPPRHQLRQRSPQGTRGRSRKTSSSNTNNRSSPKTSISPLRRLRNSPWFFPSVAALGALVLVLLYSAIRISSHTADYYPSHPNRANTPRPILKKPRVGRPGAPDATFPSALSNAPRSTSTGEKEEGAKKVKVGEEELDEAIRSALEETWHLSAPAASEGRSNEGEGIDEKVVSRTDETEPQQKKRSLSELYEELDQMGISVDELNQVMQGAIGGNL
ncbi:uncharacterized protein JCM6883_003240 [Sporobolomyces salmoneus]|uniref:uncharacterized protein n=1 Tax=Sporobolomyces salmoneus TaxID=183962 RepID=UPI0031705A72